MVQEEESLTQKSHRRANTDLAIAMLKGAIHTACYEKFWKNGDPWRFKRPCSSVEIDLERLEESTYTSKAEKAIFRDIRLKLKDVLAYQEGRPTDLSSVGKELFAVISSDSGLLFKLRDTLHERISYSTPQTSLVTHVSTNSNTDSGTC